MKIVCDACQAKYSISDDKVQGKVFKIRCKKCSNIIVVRGGAGAAEPAPAPQQEKDTRVYDYGYDGGDHAPAGDESVWHVVINQDQVGPMTAVEVQHRFASGEIDAETYIWREGFADWLPLAQVDTFAPLATSGGVAAPSGPSRSGGGAAAVASMFEDPGEEPGTSRSDPGDMFADQAPSAPVGDDDDLFGRKPAAAQASQGGSKLRGERNENSVLFSLNNLAQLASDKPAPAPAHSGSPSSSQTAMGAATGGPGGEGSGLIDIRSMASAYLGGGSGGPAKPATAGVGSIDDLPVFGGGGGGFSEPAVIVPMQPRGQTNNKLMYALIGSVGLLAVAAVVVVIIMLTGGKKAPVASTSSSTSDTATGKPGDSTGSAGTAVASAEPGAGSAAPSEPKAPATAATPPAPVAAASNPPAGNPPGTASGAATAGTGTKLAVADEPKHPTPAPAGATAHKTPTPASSGTAVKATRPADKPPAAAKADPPPAKADSARGGGDSSCDEVSCVLNNYEGSCCAKFKKSKGGGGTPAAAKSGGGGDAPESLDRAMISDGVGKMKARVSSCADKSPAKGTVKVSVKVGPDGHVTNVTVKNTPDEALGNCVAGIMQKAIFAKTQTGGSFAYPFPF